MTIRPVTAEDAEQLFEMMCHLDEETEFMLYEPGERRERTQGPDGLRARLESAEAGGDLVVAAVDESDAPVGFLWAQRGGPRRVRHTAYIVVGIRQGYRRRGIGGEFFRRLEAWARESGVTRLELTVECANTAALHLYEKQGFRVEGLRPRSMRLNGAYADEYYMGKLLD